MKILSSLYHVFGAILRHIETRNTQPSSFCVFCKQWGHPYTICNSRHNEMQRLEVRRKQWEITED